MSAALSPLDWHRRFEQQARWTEQLRRNLFLRAGLPAARRVLEVGCGSGAILAGLAKPGLAARHGLDIDPAYLALAAGHAPGAHLVRGDAHWLPYASGSFDLVFCHFLLLWVAEPAQVVAEMARLCRPGGAVLALAEPDYGGRIDHPPELEAIGAWQQAALRAQGADPRIGRRLAGLLARAGLREVEYGVLGGQWSAPPSPEEWDSEWEVLRSDFASLVRSGQPPKAGNETPEIPAGIPGLMDQFERSKRLDFEAWQRGERVLYVPTFYAWGRVLE